MLEDLRPNQKRRPCRMRTLLNELSDTDRQILKDALVSPDWTAHSLLMALRKRGLQLGYTSLRRHQDRVCSCVEADYA